MPSKSGRPARARARTSPRRDTNGVANSAAAAAPIAVAASPPPRVTAPAQRADTPVSTKITTTDYGYVAGELRRIGLLTALILVILAALWPLVGR